MVRTRGSQERFWVEECHDHICEGRGQTDAPVSQGTPKVSSKAPKLGKRHGVNYPSQPTEGTSPLTP